MTVISNVALERPQANRPSPAVGLEWPVAAAVASGAAALVATVLVVGSLVPGQDGVWVCYAVAPITVTSVAIRVFLTGELRLRVEGLPTGTITVLLAALIPALLLWATPSTTPGEMAALALVPLGALALRPWRFGPSRALVDRRAAWILSASAVIAFLITIPRDAPAPTTGIQWLIALSLLGLYLALTTVRVGSVGHRVGLGVCLMAALSVASVRTVLTLVARYHLDFYAGPANDVIHGRTVLVDTSSQYGVGVIYFMAALMKLAGTNRTYAVALSTFTVITASMCVAAYAICRRLDMGQALSSAAVLVVVAVYVYGRNDLFYDFPSNGPLRFALPLSMVLWISLGTEIHPRRAAELLQLTTLMVATVWSAETFIYTVAVFVAGRAAASLEADRSSSHAFLRNCRGSLLRGVVAIILALAALVIYSHIRSGEFPNPTVYAAYLRLYTVNSFSSLGPQPWTPWVLIAAPILVSLSVLTARWSRPIGGDAGADSSAAVTLAALTTFGVVEYSYFVARMSPDNLREVAIPSIILALCGIAQARSALSSAASHRVHMLVSAVIVACLVSAGPAVAARAGDAVLPSSLGAVLGKGSAAPALRTGEPPAPRPTTEVQVVALINAQPWPDRIPIAVDTEAQTPALLETGHANWFPVAEPCEAEQLQESYAAAQLAVGLLHPGQWVIVNEDAASVSELSHYYVELITGRFTIAQEMGTSGGIVALKLGVATPSSRWRNAPYDRTLRYVFADC